MDNLLVSSVIELRAARAWAEVDEDLVGWGVGFYWS